MDIYQKQRHRSSEKQLDHLIDFMVRNNKFASGKCQGIKGKKFLCNMWERLSNELNEIGPKKTIEQWNKVWKNQKLLTRKRNSKLKLALRKTGNLTPPPPLTDREKKVICIIGKESSEGLGFGERTIDQETSNVPNKLKEMGKIVEMPNEEDNFVENIEPEYDSSVRLEDKDISNESKKNEKPKKNESMIDKKLKRNRTTKGTQESQLLKDLIDVTTYGWNEL